MGTYARIVERHLPRWQELFRQKNQEYGDTTHFDLGIRGQFSDIYRKVVKLRRFMWDEPDESPMFEDLEEICFDLIGHLFMTVDFLHERMHQDKGDPRMDNDEVNRSRDKFLAKMFALWREGRVDDVNEMIRAQAEAEVPPQIYVGPKEVAARELLEDLYQTWLSLQGDDYDEMPSSMSNLLKSAKAQGIVGAR